MLCTGHVIQVAAALFTFPTVATIPVSPGVFAVTKPLASIVPTSTDRVDQLNGPTLEVMSTPLLRALADICCVCPDETQSTTAGLAVTRSTCRWVYTGMVAVIEPEVRVMLAVPGWKPVVSQTMKFVSHLPAHTAPDDETVTTEVLLEENVMVGGFAIAVPLEFTTVPEALTTSPRFNDSTAGLTAMELGVLTVELLPPPPHPASAIMSTKRIAAAMLRA